MYREGDPVDITATLIEAQASKHGPAHESFREPFSLIFELPPDHQLPQRAYAVRHVELGEREMFMTPIIPDPGGNCLLEAVFN